MSKNKRHKRDQSDLPDDKAALPPTVWQLHPTLSKVILGLALAPVPIASLFDYLPFARKLFPLTSKIVSPYLLTEFGQTIVRAEMVSSWRIADDDLFVSIILLVFLIQAVVIGLTIGINAKVVKIYTLAKWQRDGGLSHMYSFLFFIALAPVLGIIDLVFGGFIMHWIEPISNGYLERRLVGAGDMMLMLVGALWSLTVCGICVWLAVRLAPGGGTSADAAATTGNQ